MKSILTIHIFYFLTLEFMFSSLCYADNQHNNKNKFSDEEPLKIVGCTFPFSNSKDKNLKDATIIKNSCTPFAYPKESLVLNEEGINEFTLTISEKGIVKEVKLSSTSGFEKLDNEAKRAFSLCKFKPAEKNGKVTKSSLRVKYVWRIGENQEAIPKR